MKYETQKFIYNDIVIDVYVSAEEQNAWLTVDDMALLFCKTKRTIYRSIKEIKSESEIKTQLLTQLQPACDKMSLPEPKNKQSTKMTFTLYDYKIVTQIGYHLSPLTTSIFEDWCNKLFNKNESFTGNIITFSNNGVKLDVNISPDENTVYLTQTQMAILFNRDVSTISRHINQIYLDGELDRESTIAKNANIPLSRNRFYEEYLYNLGL